MRHNRVTRPAPAIEPEPKKIPRQRAAGNRTESASTMGSSSPPLAMRGVEMPQDRDSLLASSDDAKEPPVDSPRAVSFVQLFQRALTVRGIVDPSEAIPTFVDSETRVMHPRSTVLRVWNVTMVVILLINAVLIPAESAFRKPAFDGVFAFERVLDMFFLADIIVQFHSAYYDPESGLLIVTKSAIAEQYLKSRFWLDVLGLVPWDLFPLLIGSGHELRFLRLLRLTKLVRLMRAQTLLVNFEMDFSINYNRLLLGKLLVAIPYLTHLMACGFEMVAVLEKADVNWHTENGVEDAPPLTRYAAAMNYAAATLSCVGYGSVYAVTPAEQMYSVFALLIGAVLYAVAVSNVISVIVTMARDGEDRRHVMNGVNRFLRTNQLQRSLQVLVRQYFAQLHRYHVAAREEEERSLLKQMSPELRGLCARQMNERWLADVPFLASLSNNLLAELFMALRRQTFIPREYIFNTDDVADRMYVIRRGAVFVRNKLLTVNKAFGEEMTFSKLGRRQYSAQALQFVETWVLLRSDFLDILQDHPDLLKRIRKDALKMTFSRAAVGTLRKLAERPSELSSLTDNSAHAAEIAASLGVPDPDDVSERDNASMSSPFPPNLGRVPSEVSLPELHKTIQDLAQEVATLRKLVRSQQR